jgi:hypothetical protein
VKNQLGLAKKSTQSPRVAMARRSIWYQEHAKRFKAKLRRNRVRETRQAACEQSSNPMGLAKAILNAEGTPPLLPLLSAYGLALWALHGKHRGDGYGFPLTAPCSALPIASFMI